ncbi:MAG: cobalamin-dependent protein [bacterium]|nr:cobalamin-dependent protein [bacterium]
MLIVGIEPKAPGLNIFKSATTPRLGLVRLGTSAQELGHKCRIYCEDAGDPINWGEVILADIILLSATTSTVLRAYKLIQELRKANNKAPILIGGPHVTFLPEEALEAGADFVFRHAADQSFLQWLNWFQTCSSDRHALLGIRGLSFQLDGEYRHTQRPEEVSPDSWPTPDLRLVVGHKPKCINLIGSEGCPYDCDFCSECRMHGHSYRFRSTDKLIADLEFYNNIYDPTIPIFLCDDNLGANPTRLIKLCQRIVARGLQRPYYGQVRLDLAKRPDVIYWMSRAGFERASIGYESPELASLVACGKRLNPAQMKDLTKIFHKHGITIHSMWAIGFDQDRLSTIFATIWACCNWWIGTYQILFLTPIPGAPRYERLMGKGRIFDPDLAQYKEHEGEGRIFNYDWSKYDGHYVVSYPKGMSWRLLQILVIFVALPGIYNPIQTLWIFLVSNIRTLKRILIGQAFLPKIEFKSHLTTLGWRLAGLITALRAQGGVYRYLKDWSHLPKQG